MIGDSEIQAILYLLDDPDEDVANAVEEKLYNEGSSIIPILEEYWTGNADPLRAYRIENIIRSIQTRELKQDFQNWIESPDRDLLQACILVARIQYPGLNRDAIYAHIEKVRLDVWMAMYSAGNPIDRVQILNHILFERYGLKGNQESYHAPDNSFINRVIETRSGNPISLCNIYAIIAQRLGLPVFGVNLPQHFVLAWCEDSNPGSQVSFQAKLGLKPSDFGKVLFYINPFSNGQVFLRKNIDEFLNTIKVETKEEFYVPCDNLEIVRRMLRNLHFSYAENQNNEKRNLIEEYMKIVGLMLGDSPDTTQN